MRAGVRRGYVVISFVTISPPTTTHPVIDAGALVTYLLRQSGAVGDDGEGGGSGLSVPGDPGLRKPSSRHMLGNAGFKG